MLDSIGQAVEDSLGISSPVRRRKSRTRKHYGHVLSHHAQTRYARSRKLGRKRGQTGKRRRY